MAPGTHQLVLWTIVEGLAEVRGATVDVIQANPTGELPATGSDLRTLLQTAYLLLVAGVVLITIRRRTRRVDDR